jgi:hypothetical protein
LARWRIDHWWGSSGFRNISNLCRKHEEWCYCGKVEGETAEGDQDVKDKIKERETGFVSRRKALT